MTNTEEQTRSFSYAIAVRDGDELLLFMRVKRSSKGDYYCFFPRDTDPVAKRKYGDWNPHASHHASGQSHQKSHGRKSLAKHMQLPDASFGGNENLVTTSIEPDDARRINKPIDADAFVEVFDIPSDVLNAGGYMLAVDLVEEGGPPLPHPGKIAMQHRFADCIPEILVTLWSPERG